MSLLVYFAVMAAAMLGIARILPGFELSGWGPALTASVVLAAVNVVVKPILFILTLPLTLLTLGLFLVVLNTLMLWLTAVLVPGFRVHGMGTTLIASLLLAAVSVVWKSMTAGKR